jgi:hypothetical protein
MTKTENEIAALALLKTMATADLAARLKLWKARESAPDYSERRAVLRDLLSDLARE